MFFRRVIGSVALLASTVGAQPDPTPFDGHRVYRVEIKTVEQLNVATRLADSVWSCRWGVGPMDIQLSPDKHAAFERWCDEQQVTHSVIVADVEATFARERAQIELVSRQRGADWFATFRRLEEINARLDELAAGRPEVASTFSAGRTTQEREMRGLLISAPDQPGNPRSGRRQIMFQSAQHAREWITPMAGMYMADRLTEGYGRDPRITTVLDRAEIIIIPVVNCDGYSYTWSGSSARMWRKTMRLNADGSVGVDSNRNWGFEWGSDNGSSGYPDSEIYRGVGPFSEVETANLRDFMNNLPRLVAHVDIHSYGNLWMWPWGYTSQFCQDQAYYARTSPTIAEGLAVSGTSYQPGPVYSTIYPVSGGAVDWAYGGRGVHAWTIELTNTGFAAPASLIVPVGQETLEGMLRMCEMHVLPVAFYGPKDVPEYLTTGTPVLPTVRIAAGTAELAAASPRLLSRASRADAFQASDMTPLSDGRWRGTLPPSPRCGGAIEYYFEASTSDGGIERYPADAPRGVFVLPVRQRTILYSNSGSGGGWTTPEPTDTATAGRWGAGRPSENDAQPSRGAPPGPQTCWFTGPSAGDVDGGETTLTSPPVILNIPGSFRLDSRRLTYWRWFSNATGPAPLEDTMSVLLSADSGATWTPVEEVSDNAGEWVRREVDLGAIASESPAFRLRFVARDLPPDSTVEAGVDEVVFEFTGCPATGDFDQNGGTDGADIEAFFRAWEAGDPSADMDFDGGIDGRDIGEFLAVWERGE